MTAVLVSLLALFAPEPPSRLEAVAWLVGGQWESTAKLPDGRAIESRTIWDHGPSRNSLRSRLYVRRGDAEVLQYESVVFWNPAHKRIEHVTWSLQRPITRGTGRIEGKKLVLELPATQFPAMRSTYEPDPENRDRYAGTNDWKQGGEWRQVMRAEPKRKERRALPAFEAKSPFAAHLAPLEPLLGAWSEKWEARDFHVPVETRASRSLHGGLLVIERRAGGVREYTMDLLWAFHDPERKELRFLEVDGAGGVREGTVSVDEKRRTFRFTGTSHHPGRSDNTLRTTHTMRDDDTREIVNEVREDGEWKRTGIAPVARRVRK